MIDRLPPLGSSAFAALLWDARRRRDVSVELGTVDAGDGEAVAVLAAAGAPLRLPSGCAPPDGLRPALVDQLRTPPVHEYGAELRSIRLRRAAHDQLWSSCARPTVSVLLASRRPDDIRLAIEQVRRQVDVDVQVLVGLHGDVWATDAESRLGPLPPGSSVARVDGALPLGAVLNELATRADGGLVTKWDDDDWYGADHLADLVRAYRYSGAEVVGKAAEFVRLEGSDVTIRRFPIGAEAYSRTIAGGTLLMSAEWLAEIGGWSPLPSGVDRALLDVTHERGGCSYRTHGFQYLLRRRPGLGHTWEADDAAFSAAAVVSRRGLDLGLADIEPFPSAGPCALGAGS